MQAGVVSWCMPSWGNFATWGGFGQPAIGREPHRTMLQYPDIMFNTSPLSREERSSSGGLGSAAHVKNTILCRESNPAHGKLALGTWH